MIADTLSEAIYQIQQHLCDGFYPPSHEYEIRRLVAEMKKLRIKLEAPVAGHATACTCADCISFVGYR